MRDVTVGPVTAGLAARTRGGLEENLVMLLLLRGIPLENRLKTTAGQLSHVENISPHTHMNSYKLNQKLRETLHIMF